MNTIIHLKTQPPFRSIFTNLGGGSFYIIRDIKSSTLAIPAAGDFSKIADTNCGI
jgi:hypothetical protein